MLQDIAPRQYHVEYTPCAPSEESPCFVFRGRKILETLRDGAVCLPAWRELRDRAGEPRFLFRIDDDAFFQAELTGAEVPAGYDWRDLRGDRGGKTKTLHFAETTAYHLSVWYRDNRFCGRCGGETRQDAKERMLRCPNCGNMIFPRIAPAVIVAVTDGDRLLMTRYRGRPYKGLALIAGFNEVGETIEDTVRREVMEEVGLRVTDIRFCGSQPWGSEANLLLGFFARLEGSGEIRLDRAELSQAAWYAREEIDVACDDYSLTNHMMIAFKEGRWT